jgi:hypothetical protein
MQIPMILKGIILDPVTNMPVLILQQENATRYLPIWIGIFEANAIVLKLDNVPTPRPMTHDLLFHMLGTLEARVLHVYVNELRDNTFFAQIKLDQKGREILVDSRPSDAVALAVRCGCPIFVDSAVLDKAQSIDISSEGEDTEKLRKWLEELEPDALGKYKM